jgi:lysophospholipid acyltransferase (LPLAT)-like uncharacterized protein
MSLLKRITKSEGFQRFACYLTAKYVRFIYRTGRWEIHGRQHPETLMRDGQSFIIAFWHGRLLMLTCAWVYEPVLNLLISEHRDGRLIAQTVSHLGLSSIAGSTNRGGDRAMRAMIRALKNGEMVGITPDGPRGPRMRASIGVAALARLSGVPVVPITCSARPRTIFRSWDRFMLPKPFCKGQIFWGEPIWPGKKMNAADTDAFRISVEEALNQLTREADIACGTDIIEPAEPAPDTEQTTG